MASQIAGNEQLQRELDSLNQQATSNKMTRDQSIETEPLDEIVNKLQPHSNESTASNQVGSNLEGNGAPANGIKAIYEEEKSESIHTEKELRCELSGSLLRLPPVLSQLIELSTLYELGLKGWSTKVTSTFSRLAQKFQNAQLPILGIIGGAKCGKTWLSSKLSTPRLTRTALRFQTQLLLLISAVQRYPLAY